MAELTFGGQREGEFSHVSTGERKQPFFELLFLLAATYLAQSFSYLQVSFRFAGLPAFAHPTKQLRCVEETITTVHQGSRCAVFEFKITGVTSFVLSLLIPAAGHGSHA